MTTYLFYLGRTPTLSIAELSACFPGQTFERLSETIVQSSFLQPLDIKLWMNRLGGTTKIAQVLDEISTIDGAYLSRQLFALSNNKKISFGISTFGVPEIGVNMLAEIKDMLAMQGVGSRFVLGKNGELSSVVIEKQGVSEIILLGVKNDRILVGHTLAVQPFEEWNRRDYSRPYADPKAGMLPPKVARMIVNIACYPLRQTNNDERITLLDPFCGMGTILAEAMLEGMTVIGSDNNEEAVKYAQKNLEWLTSMYRYIEAHFNVFVSDATHVSETLKPQSIDVIVTEPFMGPAAGGNDKFQMSNDILQNRIKGLEKLYIGCLKDWYVVLKPRGIIVIALPKYIVQKREYFVKTVIDRCESLGYTILQGPLEYSRPQAVVRREFYIFQKR